MSLNITFNNIIFNSSVLFSSVQDGTYALGKAHKYYVFHPIPQTFPQRYLWNGSNCLTDSDSAQEPNSSEVCHNTMSILKDSFRKLYPLQSWEGGQGQRESKRKVTNLSVLLKLCSSCHELGFGFLAVAAPCKTWWTTKQLKRWGKMAAHSHKHVNIFCCKWARCSTQDVPRMRGDYLLPWQSAHCITASTLQKWQINPPNIVCGCQCGGAIEESHK